MVGRHFALPVRLLPSNYCRKKRPNSVFFFDSSDSYDLEAIRPEVSVDRRAFNLIDAWM